MVTVMANGGAGPHPDGQNIRELRMPTSRAPSSSGCYQPMSHEAQPLATLHIIGVTVAVLACPCMRAKNTTAALRHKGHKSRTQGHKNTTAALRHKGHKSRTQGHQTETERAHSKLRFTTTASS